MNYHLPLLNYLPVAVVSCRIKFSLSSASKSFMIDTVTLVTITPSSNVSTPLEGVIDTSSEDAVW